MIELAYEGIIRKLEKYAMLTNGRNELVIMFL